MTMIWFSGFPFPSFRVSIQVEWKKSNFVNGVCLTDFFLSFFFSKCVH